MESDPSQTQAICPNQLNHDAFGSSNISTSDKIIAEIGAGAQNVVVGKGNTQIIGYTSEQVAVIIAQIRSIEQPKGWNGRTPYIGLASFREHQANLFFGRKKLVAHLITRVKDSRLLCITGPSGSGKSSLVQAGLIPALRANNMEASKQWLFETITPSNHPLENLALAMGRMAKSPAAAEYLRSHGTSDPATLHAQAETLLSHYSDQRVILVVDQFEEIFTQTKDESMRLAFLVLLTYAAQQTSGRVSVLLVMRSDFVSQCATYPELRKLISGHLELVGAMDPEELALAIALPALEVGVEVKPELVAQVIADMRGEPGALPLMQFALKDLFDAQSKEIGRQIILTLQEYLARGGIQQSLERHANSQFSEFSSEEQAIARKIFMRLIEVGHGTVDTRRTAAFSELLPAGINPDQVEKVVQILASARLITTDNLLPMPELQPSLDTRNVTIAHEKLIEAWPWLQQLVRENRATIELQNQISADAAQWVQNKHDSSYLYTGARLVVIQEQLITKQVTLDPLAQMFIATSQHAFQDAERQRRRGRYFRVGAGVVVVVLIIAALVINQVRQGQIVQIQQTSLTEQARSAATIQVRSTTEAMARQTAIAAQVTSDARAMIAATGEADARLARSDAEQQALIAHSRQLAAHSLILQNQEPTLSLLLSQEAFRLNNNLESRMSILSALRTIAAQQNPPQNQPTMITLTTQGYVFNLAFGAEDKTLISNAKGETRIWELQHPNSSIEIRPTEVDQRGIFWSIALSSDRTILVSAGETHLFLWDLKTPMTPQLLSVIPSQHSSIVWNMAFSSDDSVLGTYDTNKIILWDISSRNTLRKIRSIETGLGTIGALAFSPNSQLLVASGPNQTVLVWDITNRTQPKQLDPLIGHTGRSKDSSVSGLQFSRNGQLLASGDDNGLVIVWSVAQIRLNKSSIITQFAQNGVVKNIVFSPDSSTLAIGSSTEVGPQIALWDVSNSSSILGMNIPLNIASLDLYGLAFSSDGQMLAMGSGAGDITVWDMNVASWQKRSCEIAKRNLTESEWLRYFGNEPYHKTCQVFDS